MKPHWQKQKQSYLKINIKSFDVVVKLDAQECIFWDD